MWDNLVCLTGNFIGRSVSVFSLNTVKKLKTYTKTLLLYLLTYTT